MNLKVRREYGCIVRRLLADKYVVVNPSVAQKLGDSFYRAGMREYVLIGRDGRRHMTTITIRPGFKLRRSRTTTGSIDFDISGGG